MTPPRPTELVHTILRDLIHPGDTAIDATAGNGHDTVFLADCVGANGRVLAFDIQEQAVRSTQARIEKAGFGQRVELYHQSHIEMAAHTTEKSVATVMFNLGYLPGENHVTTTKTESTLEAIESAMSLIKPDGVISVVCYPGHPEGATEAGEVETWMSSQTASAWKIAKYAMLGTLKPAPFLLLASKR